MSVSIVKEDLLSAVAQEMIGVLNAELKGRYPEGGAAHFRLEADEVAEGRGAFLVAYLNGAPVGCGALRTVEEGVGEIKRMYVRPHARGRGIARAVLEALETEARRLGLRRLQLETGNRQPEAIALYRRAGYSHVPAFGEYGRSPLSVCMGKDVSAVERRGALLSAFRVRDATPADAPALLAIYRPFVVGTVVSFEMEAPSVAEFEERIADALGQWAWLVAENDRGPVAYAYATSHRSRGAYRWSVETSAYVDSEHRGQGVGKALYRELLSELAAKGYCSAYAGIALPNDASIALHRSIGFTPVGVFQRAGWKFGRWHDVSWWQIFLREEPLDS